MRYEVVLKISFDSDVKLPEISVAGGIEVISNIEKIIETLPSANPDGKTAEESNVRGLFKFGLTEE